MIPSLFTRQNTALSVADKIVKSVRRAIFIGQRLRQTVSGNGSGRRNKTEDN
jgi:hypothetical protein